LAGGVIRVFRCRLPALGEDSGGLGREGSQTEMKVFTLEPGKRRGAFFRERGHAIEHQRDALELREHRCGLGVERGQSIQR